MWTFPPGGVAVAPVYPPTPYLSATPMLAEGPWPIINFMQIFNE